MFPIYVWFRGLKSQYLKNIFNRKFTNFAKILQNRSIQVKMYLKYDKKSVNMLRKEIKEIKFLSFKYKLFWQKNSPFWQNISPSVFSHVWEKGGRVRFKDSKVYSRPEVRNRQDLELSAVWFGKTRCFIFVYNIYVQTIRARPGRIAHYYPRHWGVEQ